MRSRPVLKLVSLSVGGTVLLAALFFSVLLREDTTLENSLIDMSILPSVPRRAVIAESGTGLYGELKNQTLTHAQSPYVLSGAVRVPTGVTVRAEPGATVYAAEGSHLIVEGTLIAERVSFVSNHLHPLARLWHGITAQREGVVELTNAFVTDASAALTCAGGGSLRVRGGTLQGNAAGVVTLPSSRTCSMDGVRIADGRVGFHVVGGTPSITNVTLDRTYDGLRIFHEAAPAIRALVVKRPIRSAIVYAGHPDLVVHDLTLPETSTPDALIFDGNTTPTHRWRGQEYPTGKVIVR